jgi:2-phosphoglycerate kinase
MSFKSFYVINNSGERELLSMNKMIASARRSGADLQLAKKIADNVQKKIKKDGIKTSEIYGWIKEMLASQNPKSAMKYSLKEAMRKLGPAGY